MPMTIVPPAGRTRRRPAGLVWGVWVLAMLGLAVIVWLDQSLRQTGRPELIVLTSTAVAPMLGTLIVATVGALVASRRPAHPVGWLLLAFGLSLCAAGLTLAYTNDAVARADAQAAALVAGYVPATIVTAMACSGFVLLLTPTGKLPSPRWRWWARVAAAAPVVWLLTSVIHPAPLYPEYPAIGNPLAIPFLPRGLLDVAQPAAGVVILVSLVVGAVSLVGRFRRARGTERQQLRWMAWGAGLAAVALLTAMAALVLDQPVLTDLALGVTAAVLPLATGASILRYRLYDLDRIISRTLAYGLLTVLLGLGYAGVVLGLGRLLPQGSSLVVAGATLAVAAAFQPARRRIQQRVDRRFNRRRFDAARTIEGFSGRLRQQVDLDTLTAEVLAVVDQTMQPTQASLWLRPPPEPPRTSPGALASP
jgi:hypothetical protein